MLVCLLCKSVIDELLAVGAYVEGIGVLAIHPVNEVVAAFFGFSLIDTA